MPELLTKEQFLNIVKKKAISEGVSLAYIYLVERDAEIAWDLIERNGLKVIK